MIYFCFLVTPKGEGRYNGKCDKFRIKMILSNPHYKIKVSHLNGQGLSFHTYKVGIMMDTPPPWSQG